MSNDPENKWPTTGPDFNEWNLDLDRFMRILTDPSITDRAWWVVDPDLKYLDIRIDTRNNAFLLLIDVETGEQGNRKTRISPYRVVNAIMKYQANY